MHFNIHNTKPTLYQYPHPIEHKVIFEKQIKLPSLIDLAAMKAIALGGRAKWKDYVDLYFLLKDHFTAKQIADRAIKIFKEGTFNPKLFKEQLSFFKDINYEEQVDFLPGFAVSDEEVKSFLIDVATQKF